MYRNENGQEENGKKLNIGRFRFIFYSMKLAGKIDYFEIGDKMDDTEIVRKVNLMTEGHKVWRLLVFAGTNKMFQSYISVSGKYTNLLNYYTGNSRAGIQVKCRCYPEEILYLGWTEKQDIVGKGHSEFGKALTGPACSVYYFCMIASVDSEINQRQSEFMACCNLLILALNQFPVGFLSPMYLYYVEAEIDRKKFAEYVNRQYSDIVEIEELFTLESQRLQEQRKKGMPCPEYPGVPMDQLAQEETPNVSELMQKLAWNDSVGAIEYELSQNSYKIRKWMHYPRGVMSGVVDSMEDKLDKEQLAGGFLTIAGRDLLDRQLENALESLSGERKKANWQEGFEYELRIRENGIRKRNRKKLEWRQKLVMFLVVTFMEVPFLCFALNMLLPFVKDGHLDVGGGICTMIFIVAVVFLAMLFFPMASFYYNRKRYARFLKKQMEKKTEQIKEYLQRILELVAEYQYYVRLDREQRKLNQEWEIRNKNLGHHLYIWQQSKAAKLQLRNLLDEDEQENVPHVKVDVDFGEEPQDIPYYWTAYKGSSFRAELNDSGYMMETALEFVTRFRCVDNPSKVTALHF